MWKQFVADYLNFTKRERNGILVILFLVVVCMLTPFIYAYFIKPPVTDYQAFKKAIDSLHIKETDTTAGFTSNNNKHNSYYSQSPAKNFDEQAPAGELFYFDPNTASSANWKRLGVRDKTIATIEKYLSKGGRFYKKEDLGKIWGLHKDEVERLTPYVQINTIKSAAYNSDKQFEQKEYKKEYTKEVYTPSLVDINTADTSLFIALPGIGSKLSQRIINFRDKLGGFYKVEQIGETFGLPDSTFQKVKTRLKINSSQLRQININTASFDELKAHPYLRYAIAKAIVQYRSQHGNYTAVTDLKKIMTITEEVYNKVSSYLKVD